MFCFRCIQFNNICIYVWLYGLGKVTLYAPTPQNGQTFLKNSSAVCQRIVWMCLSILWGWRLKGSEWNNDLKKKSFGNLSCLSVSRMAIVLFNQIFTKNDFTAKNIHGNVNLPELFSLNQRIVLVNIRPYLPLYKFGSVWTLMFFYSSRLPLPLQNANLLQR